MSATKKKGQPHLGGWLACEACTEALSHPEGESDCPSDGQGFCKHLTDAGAIAVSVRCTVGPIGTKGPTIFIRGGWLCAGCAKRYGAKAVRP